MNLASRILLVWVCAGVLAIAFVLFHSDFDLNYIIPGRLQRLLTMIIGGIAIAYSSIIFQTLALNRILSPAVMGYESVYIFSQALIILITGVGSTGLFGHYGSHVSGLMILLVYSWLLQTTLLKNAGRDIFFVLLSGMVLSLVITTATQFVQLKISPGEFAILESFQYASFGAENKINLSISGFIVFATIVLLRPIMNTLDVMGLGRDQAVALGVSYKEHTRILLFAVTLLVATATSLIGPTAFMGVFVANLAYQITPTFRHSSILVLASGIALILFILAQFSVEHVFNYKVTINIVINLVCGIFFFIVMLRQRSVL